MVAGNVGAPLFFPFGWWATEKRRGCSQLGEQHGHHGQANARVTFLEEYTAAQKVHDQHAFGSCNFAVTLVRKRTHPTTIPPTPDLSETRNEPILLLYRILQSLL